MLSEIKNMKCNNNELKKFGLLFFVIFLLLTIYFWINFNILFLSLFSILAVIFLILSLVHPLWLSFIYKGWMVLAIMLGAVSTRVILFIIFYFVIFPIKILATLLGKQFIDDKFKDGKETYWNQRSLEERKKINYEKQF